MLLKYFTGLNNELLNGIDFSFYKDFHHVLNTVTHNKMYNYTSSLINIFLIFAVSLGFITFMVIFILRNNFNNNENDSVNDNEKVNDSK